MVYEFIDLFNLNFSAVKSSCFYVGTPHFPKFVGIQLSYLIIPIVIMTHQTTLGVSYTVAFTKKKRTIFVLYGKYLLDTMKC
jgi:hypothetical protein